MLDLSLRDLEYVVTVHQERNITRAAQRLHMAQPALSQSLQRIERRLGIVLFERSSRRIAPTQAGLRLAQDAERILVDVGAAIARAKAAGGLTATVRVHVNEPSLLTPRRVLAAIRANLPDVAIHQTSLPWTSVTAQLESGELTLAISGRLRSPKVTSFHLRDERIGALMCRSHPLAGREVLGAADIVAFPLLSIDEDMSTWNRWITHLLAEDDLTPTWSREVIFGVSTGSDSLRDSPNILLTLESVSKAHLAELVWVPLEPARLVPWFLNVARGEAHAPHVAAALRVVDRLATDQHWRERGFLPVRDD